MAEGPTAGAAGSEPPAQQGQQADPPAPQGQQGDDGGQNGQPQAGGQAKMVEMSQDALDSLINDRLARQQRRHEQELQQLKDTAGKSEAEKLQIEKDNAVKQADEVKSQAAQRIAFTEAKVAAIEAGAKASRAEAIARNADLAEVVNDGDVDTAALKKAVEKVLADFPEWKDAPKSTKSGGEMGGGTPQPTLEEFKKMSYDKRVELYSSDADLYQRLQDQLEKEQMSAAM